MCVDAEHIGYTRHDHSALIELQTILIGQLPVVISYMPDFECQVGQRQC